MLIAEEGPCYIACAKPKQDETKCAPFVAGVLSAAQDVKISQLQTAALDTLAVILKATVGSKQLQAETQSAIKQQLDNIVNSNRSSAVKAQAIDVSALLAPNDSSKDAEMHDATT